MLYKRLEENNHLEESKHFLDYLFHHLKTWADVPQFGHTEILFIIFTPLIPGPTEIPELNDAPQLRQSAGQSVIPDSK